MNPLYARAERKVTITVRARGAAGRKLGGAHRLRWWEAISDHIASKSRASWSTGRRGVEFDHHAQRIQSARGPGRSAEAGQQVIKATADAEATARRALLPDRFDRGGREADGAGACARIRFSRPFRRARTKSRSRPRRTGRPRPGKTSATSRRRPTRELPSRELPWINRGAGGQASGQIDSMILKAKTPG